jgi:hypothetical protein
LSQNRRAIDTLLDGRRAGAPGNPLHRHLEEIGDVGQRSPARRAFASPDFSDMRLGNIDRLGKLFLRHVTLAPQRYGTVQKKLPGDQAPRSCGVALGRVQLWLARTTARAPVRPAATAALQVGPALRGIRRPPEGAATASARRRHEMRDAIGNLIYLSHDFLLCHDQVSLSDGLRDAVQDYNVTHEVERVECVFRPNFTHFLM